MQRYLDYLQTKAKGNILSQGLGDWYDLGPNRPGVSQLTPMGITGTATYYYDLDIMNNIATLLGKDDDAVVYRKKAEAVKDSFNRKFYNNETRQYGTGSQTANAMAVYMNLVEPQNREAVSENIIQDIRSRNNSLTTGDIGYRYLLKVLDEAGRSDVIFDMNSRTDVPGYGYQLVKGATALTESWQALPTVSNNHLMLGHLMEWFYAGLGGIGQEEQSIAFKKIHIRPQVVGDITHAKASYEAPYGTIMSEWKKQGGVLELDVQIPANTTATIVLPASMDAKITEGNKVVDRQTGMHLVRNEKGKAWIEMGSGTYHFRVDEPNKTTTN
jgi:alpha-L-rhamnosidase